MAASPAPDALDLREKHALEAALRDAPHSAELRAGYWRELRRIDRGSLGLCTIALPELAYPLYFRAGTSDLANFLQIFDLAEFSLPLPQAPMRILDLGAYVGYAAVYLANRFPEAEIACVEPSASNFKILSINTGPYARIRRFNGAVWSGSTRLSGVGHQLGDWGAVFAPADGSVGSGTEAWSVDEILQRCGWPRADLIKCDIEGGEKEVFADRTARWHQEALCLTVETHDRFVPGCSETVEACFAAERFDRSRSGELLVFVNREQPTGAAPPRPLRVLDPGAGRVAIELENVGDEVWDFVAFDDRSCQLHPNPPDMPPARLSVVRELGGHSVFVASVLTPDKALGPIRFTSHISNAATGRVVASGTCVAFPGEETAMRVETGPLRGRYRITLQTDMAEPGVGSFQAWAHWIDPQFM